MERTLPFKHEIDLILLAMDMALLFLPWFEAVDVAEESWRLKQSILLHLLAAELLIVRKVHHIHSSTPSGRLLLRSTTLKGRKNRIDRDHMMREPQGLGWEPHRQTK